MPSPPALHKVNPADFAIIYLGLSAEQLPLTQLDDYAETRVAQQISTIPGVAQVLVFGSHKYAVRIHMNPYALAARKLSLTQVEQAIQGGNTNLPTGTLNGSVRTYTVQADGQLQDAAAYNRLVIAYRNGAPVHLADVGTAKDSTEQDKQLTTFFDNTGGGPRTAAGHRAGRETPARRQYRAGVAGGARTTCRTHPPGARRRHRAAAV